ncbi:MAG: tetratricopeptide repeat protein [Flavobacteriales bacterium]
MDDFFFDYESDLVSRFEHMLAQDQTAFFDSQELVEIIAHYIDLGALNKVRKALDFAHHLFPQNFDLQLKEVEYHIFSQDATRAWKTLKRVYQANPTHAEVLILAAKIQSMKSEHQLAVSLLAKALPITDDKAEIYGLLGMEYYNMGRYRKALNLYKKTLAIDPTDEPDFFNALLCFDALEAPEEAIGFIERFIDENPYSDAAWSQLGRQHEKRRDYKKAVWAYDYAISIDEKCIGAYYAKAAALEKMRRFDQAIPVYLEALGISGYSALSHYKIGRCYRKMDRLQKALYFFCRVVYEAPQHDLAWNEMAVIHLKSKDFQRALYCTCQGIELNPRHIGYWKRFAYLSVRLGFFRRS